MKIPLFIYQNNLILRRIQQIFNPDKNVYFGDLHIHTSWSFDAFIYNVRTNPDDAYRFGKGEPIEHTIAGTIRNARPLDFMAVSDHAEYMGIMVSMTEPESSLAELEIAKRIRSQDRNTSLPLLEKLE